MKKISIILLTLFLLFSCGKYDDSAVRSDVEELESRVTALEQQCRIMNGNISALQALVAAVQGRDCVVSVADLSDGTGYSITFASWRTVTLRNGKDEVRKRWCWREGVFADDSPRGWRPRIRQTTWCNITILETFHNAIQNLFCVQRFDY